MSPGMRIPPARNLTILLLRHRLYGPGRFDPVLAGTANTTAHLHAADRARVAPAIDQTQQTPHVTTTTLTPHHTTSSHYATAAPTTTSPTNDHLTRPPERVHLDVRYTQVPGTTHGQSRIILRSVDQPSMGTMIDLVA